MKKVIQQLITKFFDDIYKDDNIYTNIGNELCKYQPGDIFYQNNIPIAICCGDANSFSDNKSRFILLYESFDKYPWSVNYNLIKELPCYNNIDNIKLNTNKLNSNITDENGYENTKIIQKYYDIDLYPSFRYCLEQNEYCYLPSIKELYHLYLNKNIINKQLKQLSKNENINTTLISNLNYWSSTQTHKETALALNLKYNNISNTLKYENLYIRPFIKLF